MAGYKQAQSVCFLYRGFDFIESGKFLVHHLAGARFEGKRARRHDLDMVDAIVGQLAHRLSKLPRPVGIYRRFERLPVQRKGCFSGASDLDEMPRRKYARTVDEAGIDGIA